MSFPVGTVAGPTGRAPLGLQEAQLSAGARIVDEHLGVGRAGPNIDVVVAGQRRLRHERQMFASGVTRAVRFSKAGVQSALSSELRAAMNLSAPLRLE